MNKKNVYDRIEEVLKQAGRALIPDEFGDARVTVPDEDMPSRNTTMPGKTYVACSYGTLGRRMREMAEQGRLTRQKRAGKQYVEFGIAPNPVAALPEAVS